MLTRGYLVGECVDELSALAAQAEMRAKLGLTDIHIFIENFFKEILEILIDATFENANGERNNAPGVDLLSGSLGWAVQVTTLKSKEKVEKTLEAYGKNYRSTYSRLLILILGRKQGTYSIDPQLLKVNSFDPKEDIWDVSNLSHKILDLELDRLQSLHSLIKRSVMKVRIELEIPNEEGAYSTTAYGHLERAAKPKLGSIDRFISYVEKAGHKTINETDRKAYEASFEQLVIKLSRLPRVTREFTAILLEHRDKAEEDSYGGIRVNHSRIKRFMKGFDMVGELAILQDDGIIEIEEPEDGRNCPLITFPFFHGVDAFLVKLSQYIEHEGKLDFRKVIGQLDFEGF